MNKTIAFFFLFGFFAAAIAKAQSFTYTEVLTKKSDEIVKVICESNDETFIIKRIEDNKTDIVLDVLDSNNQFIVSHSFSFPITKIKKVGIIQDELVVFGVLQEGNSDIIKLFTIESKSGKYAEKSLLTLTANGGYRTAYDVSISPSGKYFSLIGSQAYSVKAKEIINISIYDSLQNQVYSDEMLTTFPSAKRRHNVLVCNDKGFNYLVKKDRVKNKNNYYVYTISKEGTQDHGVVRLKSRQIVDAEYALDVDGDLILAGFYSSPISFNFEGLFIAKYEEKVTPTFTKEYLLNANVIEAFKSKKEIKEYGYGLDYFKSKNLVFTDEKNMMLIAEHHSVKKGGKDGPEDYRKGFVLFNIDINGGFKFSTPVITEQTDGKTMGYWSSNYLLNNEGSPIVYLNRIGDGAKSAKSSAQEQAGLPVEALLFSKSGTFESVYSQFDSPLLNYCLNTNLKNKTGKSIICFESLDRKAYTFGTLKSTDE